MRPEVRYGHTTGRMSSRRVSRANGQPAGQPGGRPSTTGDNRARSSPGGRTSARRAAVGRTARVSFTRWANERRGRVPRPFAHPGPSDAQRSRNEPWRPRSFVRSSTGRPTEGQASHEATPSMPRANTYGREPPRGRRRPCPPRAPDDRLTPARDLELVQHVRDVVADGLRRDRETLRDLAVRTAGRDQLEDSCSALRQVRNATRWRPDPTRRTPSSGGRSTPEDHLADCRCAKSLEGAPRCRRPSGCSAGAGPHCREQRLVVLGHRDDEDPD